MPREYDKHKRTAWRKVEGTIRGAAVAQPCEVCGGGPTSAHHWDYDQPLSVHWLCQRHHSAAHMPALAGPGMTTTKHKTDNASVGPKLALRRHFLSRYHGEGGQPAIVLDACQGSGVLWSRLRSEFEIVAYQGVDRKPKKGRLTVESSRLLELHGWPYTVIDVDTYGSPWKHWFAILRNATGPVTVFLTIGQAGGLAGIDTAAAEAMGLHRRLFGQIPKFFGASMLPLAVDASLGLLYRYGWKCVECREAPKARNARYIGIRIAPKGLVDG